jgi:hypothetical protein
VGGIYGEEGPVREHRSPLSSPATENMMDLVFKLRFWRYTINVVIQRK